jgi:transcriptional regulator with XRE-family HTH domain
MTPEKSRKAPSPSARAMSGSPVTARGRRDIPALTMRGDSVTPDGDASGVGVLLRRWRGERNFSLSDLARASGVSSSTLSRWESGRTRPRALELETVLDVLRVPDPYRLEARTRLNRPRALRLLAESVGPPPPVSGDLLRALRMRAGRTQTEVAAAIGVQQGTLAKWERSECWPSPERLQSLCWELHAFPEEAAALAHGVFLPRELPGSLDEIAARLPPAHWRGEARPDPLTELNYLLLEAAVWPLAQRDRAAREVQGRLFLQHAFFLHRYQRGEEAREYAERLIQIAPRDSSAIPAYAQSGVILSAVWMGRRRNGSAARLAARRLREADGLIEEPEHCAWRLMQMAMLTARAEPTPTGEAAALEMAAQSDAVPCADGLPRPENAEARRQRAWVYILLNRVNEALDLLGPEPEEADAVQETLEHRYLQTEALARRGTREAARESLSRLNTLAERADPLFLRTQRDRLARLLFGETQDE